MSERHIVIVGGGLAGLSAGCYARAAGFRTTIVEHNLALGGVCTAWSRGAYTIDGCIHWLTGGPFTRIYEELGITAAVPLRPIHHFSTYRDARDGSELRVTRDLDALSFDLRTMAPDDASEIQRLIAGAAQVAEMNPRVDRPQELATVRDNLRGLWDMRHEAGTLLHFRKPVGEWAAHLHSERLRRIVTHLVPESAPALFLLMILGYLQRGWLSRPAGGTAAFRDALIATYRRLGGEVRLNATVDEILVARKKARGVRLADGTMLSADVVISTASAPETVLRLLAGRYDARATRERMAEWPMTPPIVLASFGVAMPLTGVPAMLMVDRVDPFEMGGHVDDSLYLRICNDDPTMAPPGHAVVQALLGTDYEWWATRGTRYQAEKDLAAEIALGLIDRQLPGVRDAVRAVDIATPLTYWSMARSWRGAFEGWMPNAKAFFGHIDKRLDGLGGFYMAGQWVEPGGGVPTALASGRQVVQIVCADADRRFVGLREGEPAS